MAFTVGSSVPQLVREVAAPVTALATTVVADRSVTVTGATPDMCFHVNWPALDAGLILVAAWCDAVNVVKVRLYNPTGSTITPIAATLKIIGF